MCFEQFYGQNVTRLATPTHTHTLKHDQMTDYYVGKQKLAVCRKLRRGKIAFLLVDCHGLCPMARACLAWSHFGF